MSILFFSSASVNKSVKAYMAVDATVTWPDYPSQSLTSHTTLTLHKKQVVEGSGLALARLVVEYDQSIWHRNLFRN